jgi:outer membrane murein-binding lipoprotein Lpp
MWDKVKPYVYSAIALVLLYAGYRVYTMYQEYAKLKLEHDVTAQNLQAAKDEAAIGMARLTVLTAYVRDLQNDSTKLTHKYLALQTLIKVLIDSLSITRPGSVEVADTKVRVDFEGDKSIVHYKGFTIGDAATKVGSVTLMLDFPRPIDLKHEVWLDDNDGKWKISTESLTPLVRVRGVGVIDEVTFAAMQKYSAPSAQRWLGIGLSATGQGVYGNAFVRVYKDIWVGGGYRINNHEQEWYKNAKVDALWTPF